MDFDARHKKLKSPGRSRSGERRNSLCAALPHCRSGNVPRYRMGRFRWDPRGALRYRKRQRGGIRCGHGPPDGVAAAYLDAEGRHAYPYYVVSPLSFG